MTQYSSTLEDLINRSEDLGHGWRQCSDLCWQLVTECQADNDIFELDHSKQRVRIKTKPKKPSMNDLLNQIYEWREKSILELRRREALDRAKLQAKGLLS